MIKCRNLMKKHILKHNVKSINTIYSCGQIEEKNGNLK